MLSHTEERMLPDGVVLNLRLLFEHRVKNGAARLDAAGE